MVYKVITIIIISIGRKPNRQARSFSLDFSVNLRIFVSHMFKKRDNIWTLITTR